MKRLFKITILIFTIIYSIAICGCSNEVIKMEKEYGLNVNKDTVKVTGINKDFEIMLIADTHVSLCDNRDMSVYSKASTRYNAFLSEDGLTADQSFRQLMEYVCAKKPDVLVLAGDIVDSAMELSIELVTEQIALVEEKGIDVIYSMGNHDFEYGSEYFSEKSYSEYLPRFKEISKTENGFQVREYDDLIIFLADDGSNKVSQAAAEKLMELSSGEKPVIVVSHVPIEPLIENDLWQETIDVWRADSNGNSRVLLGINSCYPNDNTKTFIDSITKENTKVCAVLAGHVHFYDKSVISKNGVVQITTGAGYQKYISDITFIK